MLWSDSFSSLPDSPSHDQPFTVPSKPLVTFLYPMKSFRAVGIVHSMGPTLQHWLPASSKMTEEILCFTSHQPLTLPQLWVVILRIHLLFEWEIFLGYSRFEYSFGKLYLLFCMLFKAAWNYCCWLKQTHQKVNVLLFYFCIPHFITVW